MTCAELHDRLDDYVDGLLDERDFQETELHLAGCDACRREERRLRAILARAAALPREVAPGRDLWPGIEERLHPHAARRRGPYWPFGRRPADVVTAAARRWLMPALAAAAAVLALVTLVPRAGTPPPTVTGQAHTVSAGDGSGALDAAEVEYARATAELMGALQARRATLPPATAASVDENLRAIDQALRDLRKALDEDPHNAQLAHLLNATHRRKVAFLQQLVKLSTLL